MKKLCLFENRFVLFYRGLYEINLDKRKLKTPGGKLFTVPNEALAIAVATEWDVQKDTLKVLHHALCRSLWLNQVKSSYIVCILTVIT